MRIVEPTTTQQVKVLLASARCHHQVGPSASRPGWRATIMIPITVSSRRYVNAEPHIFTFMPARSEAISFQHCSLIEATDQ